MDCQSLYAYFGHHKCASTFISDVIRSVCWDLNLEVRSVGSPETFGKNLKDFLEHSRTDFLICYAADDRFVSQINSFKGFHVIRDPRDILVSSYYSHLKTHSTKNWPELVEHRRQLVRMSKEEGLLCELDCRKDQFEVMAEWDYLRANILELKFEQLVTAPVETFQSILQFLGLLDQSPDTFYRAVMMFIQRTFRAVRGRFRISIPVYPSQLPLERLARIVFEQGFYKKSGGRNPGEENPGSHYRKGTPGDWKNHFTEPVKAEFKRRYDPFLLKLGYEESVDW